MSLVSIIIPNYNYGRFFDRLFGSIAAQTVPLEDVQLLFVDDGSSDDSLQRAHEWRQRLRCGSFEIFSPPRSGKPGPVRNFGLDKADGQFIFSLDPDDALGPGYIESCLEVLEGNPEVSLVYTDYLEIGPEYSREVVLPDFKPVYLRTQNPVSPTALYRRKVLESGVRYRENTAYEDWDFWIQCLMQGAGFRHIGKSLYNYHIHGGNYSCHAVKDDGPSKARIVLNNPSFFNPAVQMWASDHLRGRDYAPSFRRGYIPTASDIDAVLKLFEA